MRARRNWAAVATVSTGGRGGVFTSGNGRGVSAAMPSGAPNGRYESSSAVLDAARTSSRFVAHTSIDAWREKMRQDDGVRFALLNCGVDDEPRER